MCRQRVEYNVIKLLLYFTPKYSVRLALRLGEKSTLIAYNLMVALQNPAATLRNLGSPAKIWECILM